jgi:type I site-specific restriction endonuclease
MAEAPEQKARREIDANLTAAGWRVQDRKDLDLTAGRGIAVREFPMKSGFGFADYLLYLDRRAVGAVEAKPEGTLTGVEAQSATGSGKTFTAVNVAYRLLKFAAAKRILFLVDRGNLGKQTEDEFANFEPPDDPRKFPTLYTVQRLKTNNQLDRDVVSESQIRTVLQQFRDRVLPDAFPGRTEAPKTLIFAKDDSHADDIVRLVREVFAQGNDFCQKITYRTGFTKITKKVRNDDGSESELTEWVKTSNLTPDEILANFRNSFFPRVAVTVDMISTGTDVKPIECVFFLRNVKSAGFFEQMKGRGVRVLSPDKLRVVSPTAMMKDRFIIVDAVGVCEQDKTDSHTLNRQPSKTLEQVLEYVAQGGTDALARPPLSATPVQLWRALEATDPLGVAESSPAPRLAGESLADLVKLVRHAIEPDDPLRPYADEVRSKYVVWKAEQRRTGTQFTFEQEEWLDRMAEHIAASLAIEPEDFETGWFGQQGSLGKAHALFGDRLKPLMEELNERLAA